MKSFALHLVVVFIIGAQYHHQIGILCSSTLLASSSSSSSSSFISPQVVNGIKVLTAADTAHDHINSSRRIPSSSSSSSLALARNINSSINSSNSSFTGAIANTLHHQQRQQQQRIQRNQQTKKTTRTIQRLVGGHLQHTAATTTTTTKSSENKRTPNHNYSTTPQLSNVYFRRKPVNQLRNTYYSNQNDNIQSIIQNNKEADYNDIEDLNSDAALLEDPWDNGILRSSAGGGKEHITKSKKKDDSKKTLADQVRDGKYGLIEKELFQEKPERPGIISYLSNKEVPNDNIKNLGGLNEEDIWLAEDHLLVLRGGSLSDNNEDQPWEPIDDYQAPSRQIKIPANPKVPPPFPVQFEDNGPIQFIGNNKVPFINSFINESLPYFSGNGYLPSTETTSDNEKNTFTGTRASKNSTENKSGYFYSAPYPSWLNNNQNLTNSFLNTPSIPPTGKGPSFPPIFGGSFDNLTDYIDEDDPSLYYPPPYSFVYESNYSSPVAPGPLVPGIVLPPPPNAFARLEGKKPSKPSQQEIPFRQILTKISEYKPKTVTVTTLPPPPTTTKPTSPPPTTTILYTTTPKDIVFTVTKPTKKPERVRVHTPPTKQYVPVSQYVTPAPPPQTSPPEIISFVPKVPIVPIGGGSAGKGNPIYYEYFDARKVPNNQNYYNQQDYIPPSLSTPPPAPPIYLQPLPPPQPRPYNKIQITTIRPVQQPPRLSKSYLPIRPFNYEDYVYITPKPEIRPNGISDHFASFVTKSTYKPIHDFEHEVDAIRQTLHYYKSQQLQQNIIPRTPRPKPVYEYSFDATRSNRNFNPPLQIDDEPFKPMVKYSPSVDDENGFKAIPYAKSDEGSQFEQDYYIRTSTLSPIQNTAKTFIQPIVYETTPIPEKQTDNVQRPIQGPGWISIEKQVVHEIIPQSARVSAPKQRASAGFSRNVNHAANKQFSDYQYTPSQSRQNTRYYQIGTDETFSRQINSIKSHLRPYKLREPINLENDTYVNYLPERPQINPDAEFIHPQNFRHDFYQQSPPPLTHSQRLSNNNNNRGSSYQPSVSLQRDILVNYRQPLPSINLDSEYQPQSQIINRNPSQYRSVPKHRQQSEQTRSYYLPSRNFKYTRHSN